jgi:CheY-like chemotaxis protein/nitrogen-specific signal transduction histidine kinase
MARERSSTGPPASAGPSAAIPPADGALRARVLIVDDDERNLFAATSALEELGHEIVLARSGEEALKRLLQEDFAVILLDLHMPGMDGYETAGYIRQRRRTSHIPIVFLTAVFRDEAHLFQAYSAGAVDVVFKPIDPFILRSKVQVLIDLHLKTVEMQLQAAHRERLLAENARVHKEKLEAEQALRRSEERQRAIQESLPIVFHSRSMEPPYRPLFLSGNVEALTGFSPDAFMAEADFGSSRIHPDDLQTLVQAVAGAAQRGAYSCEFRWLCADGEYRRFLDQGILAPPELGLPGEIIGTLLDVTERRSLEEQLSQARKMESVGQLTGGVAHDFNNLLTVIIGNLDLLTRRAGHDERTERQLAAMRYAAERGRGLTRQLLAFSRRQHLSPVTLDVNALIASFASLLKQAVGDAVTVELDLAEVQLKAHVDAAQLETALLNLAVNARDAMPEGGRLTIRTRLMDRPGVRAAALEGPGPFIGIEVADTGVGIPASALERIFEPFFTTKEVGKGSGLGLSQVYGFVQQSGGHIAVDSQTGAGSSFRLFLKMSERELAVVAEPSASDAPSPGSGRLLVVEDDPQVLAVTVQVLRELGYEAITASNAQAALDWLETGEPVDLLFSDVVMPGGCNGVELARRAKAMRPDLKVLLSSGYVGEAAAMAAEAFELIDKPYEQASLAARLARLLGDDVSAPKRKGASGGRPRASSGGEDRAAEARRAHVS